MEVECERTKARVAGRDRGKRGTELSAPRERASARAEVVHDMFDAFDRFNGGEIKSTKATRRWGDTKPTLV